MQASVFKMVCIREYILLLCVIVRGSKAFVDIPTTINNIVESLTPPLPYDEQYVEDTWIFKNEYDFIIVGAGSAGSVMANRLTEVSDWSVLLLEAGREEIYVTDIPMLAPILSLTAFDWGYKSEKPVCTAPEESRCVWARGKVMGGSSAINYMVYSRGNRKDFDKWAQAGNPGWSYDEVFPYFLKSERNNIPEFADSFYHSSNGLMNVEYSGHSTPLLKTFLEAGVELGYNISDPNGVQNIGFSRIQCTMRKGKRCSASKAFLRPIRHRKNLSIAQRARVTKILIDPVTKKAIGVEFTKNKVRRVIRAKKEVILSAGAFNSPQLLMLSGVGPREHLEELGIETHEDLPVGYNMQNHISVASLTFIINDTVSIRPERMLNIGNIIDYVYNGKGMFTIPSGVEATAFVKTKYSEDPNDDYPDIELILGSLAIEALGSFTGSDSGNDTSLKDDAFTILPVVLQPKSRGRVMLKSKNPLLWPLIFVNNLQVEDDAKVLEEGMKMVCIFV